MTRWVSMVSTCAAVAIAVAALAVPSAASPSASLTRFPYLTDLVAGT